MRVTVRFQDESVDLNVPDEVLIGQWHGPAGIGPEPDAGFLAIALEAPSDYPALRQSLVPGDRVTVALGGGIPDVRAVLDTLFHVFETSGVTPETVTVVTEPDSRDDLAGLVPPGTTVKRHDPDDRTQLAYLASTTADRRVYLNRDLADADIVVPVGRLGYDPTLGYTGPWGVIFPGLSDTETARAYKARASEAPPDRSRPSALLTESVEVSWLLGSQFQVGLVPGVTGTVGAVAGLAKSVLDEGSALVDRSWSYRSESRSELVIVGVGLPGEVVGMERVALGLAQATRLVQRGGKVVVLSTASGPFGPAVQSLMNLDNPGQASTSLRRHEAEPDYPTAKLLAGALAWADVYLYSGFNPSLVDDLGVVPLDHPREAGRLAALCGSCQVVSHADRVRAVLVGDTEGD